MLTMVYTIKSYTVVYNLFFHCCLCIFCLLVGMCYVLDMSLAWMDVSCLFGGQG